MRMKRDLLELLMGIGVLALGLVVLLFTFSQALALAQDPGDFLRSQVPETPRGPTSTFDWTANDLTLTVLDASNAGDSPIVSWAWDFGDGTRVNVQNPGPHPYASSSAYNVTLVVRDQNGLESTSFAAVQAIAGETRSGRSVGNPFEGGLGLDLSGIVTPLAIAFLVFGLYIVMAVVGGMITRAGWNLVKPKPETIKLRLKPRDLTSAIEQDAGLPPPPPHP
jgi:hypothetical protein